LYDCNVGFCIISAKYDSDQLLFHESLVNSKIEFMSQYKNWADFLLLIFLEQHLLFQRNTLQWTTVCEQSKWICSQVFTLNSNLSTAAH